MTVSAVLRRVVGMKYWYRKWALIQLIFIFFVFLAIAVVFPGLYTVSSMYWVLLIADLAITLSLSCFLARQLEPWAQDNPWRGPRAGSELTDYLHRRLYEFAEGLVMTALIVVTMATLVAGGAGDQIQIWNIVLSAAFVVGAVVAFVLLRRALIHDAEAEDDA